MTTESNAESNANTACQKPLCAAGIPPTGSGFSSSCFRVQLFKEAASEAWSTFIAALDQEHEDSGLDIEAGSLRLLTLTEEVLQKAKGIPEGTGAVIEHCEQPECKQKPSLQAGGSSNIKAVAATEGGGANPTSSNPKIVSATKSSRGRGRSKAAARGRGRSRDEAHPETRSRTSSQNKRTTGTASLQPQEAPSPQASSPASAVADGREKNEPGSLLSLLRSSQKDPGAIQSSGNTSLHSDPRNSASVPGPAAPEGLATGNSRDPFSDLTLPVSHLEQLKMSRAGKTSSHEALDAIPAESGSPVRQSIAVLLRARPKRLSRVQKASMQLLLLKKKELPAGFQTKVDLVGSSSSDEEKEDDGSSRSSDESGSPRKEALKKRGRQSPPGGSQQQLRKKITWSPYAELQGANIDVDFRLKKGRKGRNFEGKDRGQRLTNAKHFIFDESTLGGKVEKQRRQAFADAAKDLKSVRDSLASPLFYSTPFAVKPQGSHLKAKEGHRPAAAAPGEDDSLAKDEVLLSISVREFDAHHWPLQEFLVPASQILEQLREVIECPADRNMRSMQAGVSGAFFYIEGTFFEDSHCPEDYVANILDFCALNNIKPPLPVPEAAEALPDKQPHLTGPGTEYVRGAGEGDFRREAMAKVRWQDLGLRVGPGAGYVFCHQGCCEHLLVIKDVRRIHPDDPPLRSAYPLLTKDETCVRRNCDICETALARHVAYEDKFSPDSPSFWCSVCYGMMHYNAKGVLRADAQAHRVFPYQSG